MKKKTEGFEDLRELELFQERLKEKHKSQYYIWRVSLNLALRISDTLAITIEEAREYIKTGIYLSKDIKTGKRNSIKLSKTTIKDLKEALKYRESIKLSVNNPYLFVGTSNRSKSSLEHITRFAVNKAYDSAIDDLNLDINIGTHSARKTWGLQAYKNTKSLPLIMTRLNHSSEATTLLYIGITEKKQFEFDENFSL